MIVTVLAFVLTLGVLIVIHEYGHYRVAVACGVKVLRFSVGFGRVVWRRKSGPDGTEFVLSALPLGGYVRMLDEREGAVAPGELHRAFNRKSLPKRAAIVAAGPLANLLLAVLLYAAGHWIGVDEPKAVLGPPVADSVAARAGVRAGDWARAYSPDGLQWTDLRSMTDLRWELTQGALQGRPVHLLLTDAQGHGQRRVVLPLEGVEAREVDNELMRRIGIGQPHSEPVLGEVKVGGPAAAAGLRSGDRVLAIDGASIGDAAQVRDRILASGRSGTARPMLWRFERAGQTLETTVTPSVVVLNGERVGRVELYPGQPPEMVLVRYDAVEGFTKAVSRKRRKTVFIPLGRDRRERG